MKKTLSLMTLFLVVMLLAGTAMAAEKKAAKKAGPKPAGVVVDVVSVTAAVEAVDAAKRTVTLKMPNGMSRTIKLGPEVKNFDQIKVGDNVKATFYESVAILVAKAGEKPSAMEVQTVEVAAKGDKPGTVVTDVLEITAVVEKINYKKRTVTLKGPEGNVKTFTVDKSAKNFKNIKKGDDVYIRVTDAVAVTVVTPAN